MAYSDGALGTVNYNAISTEDRTSYDCCVTAITTGAEMWAYDRQPLYPDDLVCAIWFRQGPAVCAAPPGGVDQSHVSVTYSGSGDSLYTVGKWVLWGFWGQLRGRIVLVMLAES